MGISFFLSSFCFATLWERGRDGVPCLAFRHVICREFVGVCHVIYSSLATTLNHLPSRGVVCFFCSVSSSVDYGSDICALMISEPEIREDWLDFMIDAHITLGRRLNHTAVGAVTITVAPTCAGRCRCSLAFRTRDS